MLSLGMRPGFRDIIQQPAPYWQKGGQIPPGAPPIARNHGTPNGNPMDTHDINLDTLKDSLNDLNTRGEQLQGYL